MIEDGPQDEDGSPIEPELEQIADQSANLTDEQLIALYRDSAEEDLMDRLRDTAVAARKAAVAYTSKASNLQRLSDRLERTVEKHEKVMKLSDRSNGRGAADSVPNGGEALDQSALDNETEKRW